MELNFDKEIDAILRKARDGETAFAAKSAQTHLDADTLSAFAENALPEKAKMRATTHLADCDRCRKILSNLILLASETESEIVHADAKEILAPPVPWYRKLFVFPNLVYSLGALALVFGGLIVFTVLQNFKSLENATVSQVSNKSMDTKSAPSAANTNSAMSVSNSVMANTAFNSNANFAANKPSAPLNEMPKASPPIEKDSDTYENYGSPTTEEAQQPQNNQPLNLAKDKPAAVASQDAKEPVRAENKPLEVDKNKADDEKLREKQELPSPQASGAIAKSARKKVQNEIDSTKTGETTNVGGKTFRRSNNVWYDAAYSNQPTTNITRGSGEYKKLDSGLRSIAENLGGTIVIVWKSKAYRIQ